MHGYIKYLINCFTVHIKILKVYDINLIKIPKCEWGKYGIFSNDVDDMIDMNNVKIQEYNLNICRSEFKKCRKYRQFRNKDIQIIHKSDHIDANINIYTYTNYTIDTTA
eukprot:348256_1